MKVALAQIKGFLGDFKETRKEIIRLMESAGGKADFILFPEGGLFGYPPTDFLNHRSFLKRQDREIREIQKRVPPSLGVLLGAFVSRKDKLFNGAFLLRKGKPPLLFKKEFLANGDVFRESRYFSPGSVKDNFFLWRKKRIQILICEDIFQNPRFPKPDALFCLNSSPYIANKFKLRLKAVESLIRQYKCPAVYVNRVGGQGEVIFDGASFALSSTGKIQAQCAFFKPDLQISRLDSPLKGRKALKKPSLQEQREQALILGLKDFFAQTEFEKAHLGLSGGMDSALVCCLAVKALGAENVTGIFLPGPFTTHLSYKLSKEVAGLLGVSFQEHDISSLHKLFLKNLFPKQSPKNSVTAQNIQARIRSLILTAFGNERKSLLLGTGNKSELACGYSTLYGDLCGGLLPIGDLYKTEVYDLARFINKTDTVFPPALLRRAPSAELKPRQKDSDDLPPYTTLDPILKKLLKGANPQSSTEKVIFSKTHLHEFKRKQAPPILKISENSFGEEWNFPIAHKFPLQKTHN